MPTYLIGYDLHEGEDYSDLEKAIRTMAPTYWHHLDSTWIIVHPGKETDIRNALIPYLVRSNEAKSGNNKAGDKLLVVKLSGSGAWTTSFGEKAGGWLKRNL